MAELVGASRKFDSLFFGIGLVDSRTQRTFLVAGIVERIGWLIPSQEILHFELTFGNLFDQVSSDSIQVQVIVSVAFTHHYDIFRIENNVRISLFLDVLFGFVAYSKLAQCASRIGHIDVEPVGGGSVS